MLRLEIRLVCIPSPGYPPPPHGVSKLPDSPVSSLHGVRILRLHLKLDVSSCVVKYQVKIHLHYYPSLLIPHKLMIPYPSMHLALTQQNLVVGETCIASQLLAGLLSACWFIN